MGIWRISVADLYNEKSTLWIEVASTEGMAINDEVMLYDEDFPVNKGAKIIKIDRKNNRIRVVTLFTL